MFIFYFLMASLMASDSFCVWPETPKKSQTLQVEGISLVGKQKPFTIKLRFLGPGEFLLFCQEKGLSHKLLNSEKVKEKFAKWFSVECKVVNYSNERIYINPSQIMVQNHKEPVGTLVEPGFFLTRLAGPENGHFQAISGLFDQSSMEVPAGETRTRVVTFRPIGDAFPMQTLNFIIDYIYVGIENYPLKGRISLKPCATQ